jgi:hypothetical protein
VVEVKEKLWTKEKVMDFVDQILKGIEFVPALVSGIEGLFRDRSGAEKKDAAMAFLENALSLAEGAAGSEIQNQGQFREGLSQIVDGVVQCMNASSWAKGEGKAAAASDSVRSLGFPTPRAE